MSQKTYLWILKIGSYAALVTVFFVFKSLLFPYITSKQIAFNMLIEALFIFWLAFIIKYPEWRPRRSWITIGLAAFFLTALLSSFTGIDFNLSFWGDVERMLGVFHILHFFAFYLIIITVMRDWRDWRVFFIISVLFAVGVSFKVFSGAIYGTIGNTAYVSGYLIFNIYFCLLLFFRDRRLGLRWLYLAPLPILLAAFEKQDTTGAFVGLGASVIVMFFLYGIFARHKRVRTTAFGVFLVLAVATIFIFANKDKEFIRANQFLNPIAGISFQRSTFQTRLISWRAALKDFPNHPVLGTGFGNYAVIFDKHFDPKFYNFTRAETYFDRAHNNLIDIASTTGALGALAYLSIFGAAFYYLWRGFFRERIGQHTFVLLNSLIVAYFVQNLAVFDSLVTYVGIMIVLAFIYWLSQDDREEYDVPPDRPLENKEIYALFFAGAALLSVLYFYNVRPLQMLVATIDGQRAYQQGGIAAATEEYRRALSYQTPLDRDSRTSYNRLLLANPNELKQLDPETARAVVDFNLELAEANVAYNRQDSLNQMILAQLLNNGAAYYSGQPEKFEHYSQRALEAIDMSIAATPGRVPVYFQKAQIYLTRNEQDKAVETLRYAVTLNEDYPDSHCYLARTLLFMKDEEAGWEAMDFCVDLNGADIVFDNAEYTKMLINHYTEIEDYSRLVPLYRSLVRKEPDSVQGWINLAKVYAHEGMMEKAVEAAQKAAEIEPDYAPYAEEFISSLK